MDIQKTWDEYKQQENRKPLVLFGFKGCGKTFFGQQLAQEFSCPHLDTDTLLSSNTARALYLQVGEKAFKEKEREAVLSIPKTFQGVISLGGGAILDESVQAFLLSWTTCVYLKVCFATIVKRLTLLPAFVSSLEELENIYYKREPLYAAIKATVCDVDKSNNASALQQLKDIYGSK